MIRAALHARHGVRVRQRQSTHFLFIHLFVSLSHTNKKRIRSQKMDPYNGNSQRAFVLCFQVCLFSQLELYFQFHFYWNNWLHGKTSDCRIWFGCLLSRYRTNTSAILEWQSCVSRESWSTRSRFLSYLQWWSVISWMRKQCRYYKKQARSAGAERNFQNSSISIEFESFVHFLLSR